MVLYRIGQLAELATVSRRTIDYYTQLGMLNYERNGRYRYYTEDAIKRLRMISRYKEQNMPLTTIKERLNIWSDTTCDSREILAKVDKIAVDFQELEREMLALKPFLNQLNEKQQKFVVQQLSIRGEALLSTMKLLS